MRRFGLRGCWLLPVFVASFLITLLLYRPALNGPFLFDDFPNLSAIGDLGGVRNLTTLRAYLDGGFSGPTGRPVALLSFLLDDYAWPSDPLSFKRTNLLFHFCVALVLCGVAYRVTSLWFGDREAVCVSMFAAVLWLLHPLWVSTVMYVVQRMAILAAFFSLLSIWAYLLIRPFFASRPVFGGGLFIVFVAGFAVLSTLSKENGALTVLFIWVIEAVLVSPKSPLSRFGKLFFRVCVVLPSIAIICYLLYRGIVGWDVSWSSRDFTLPERLLTESRIMWMYLHDIIIPKSSTAGLFTDFIEKSTGLFSPLSTFISIVAILSSIVFALLFRNKFPFLSAGILFFFAGHLLESSVIGLELYFEHRNYLPSVFLFISFAVMTLNVPIGRSARVGLVSIVMIILCIMLGMRASLWSSQYLLSLHWAENAPMSSRAQIQAAMVKADEGDYPSAHHYLQTAISNNPDAVDPLLARVILDCKFEVRPNLIDSNYLDSLGKALAETKFKVSTFKYLQALVGLYSQNQCSQVSTNILLDMIDSFLINPVMNTGSRKGMLLHLKGDVYLDAEDFDAAYFAYEESFSKWQSIDPAMLSVASLASHGQVADALRLLEIVKNRYQKSNLQAKRDYTDDIIKMQSALDEAL